MKKTITAFVLLAAAVSAPAQTPAQTKKKADTTTAPHAVTIPKDAVANPDGVSYTYTDKQGKKWIYAKTPFGIIKNAAADTATTSAAAPDAMTKAIDKGDTVRFERPGPFGVISWEKKKTELTDDERHIVDASSAKQQ